MTDHDHKPEDASWRVIDDDSLEHEVDAALAEYAAAEPRAGLEKRILANLEEERKRTPFGEWGRWTAVAALGAAVIVVVLSFMFRSAHQQRAAQPVPLAATPEENIHSGTQAADPTSVKPRIVRKLRHLPVVATAGPRLAQFPSPQPLSEQERILESYIEDYPDHAALIAEARTEALRQDEAEKINSGVATKDKDSQQ
jgi:hypothetical protein